MRFLLLVPLLLTLTLADVDPDEKTDAGEQKATASKVGDTASIGAKHAGGRKGPGEFSGTATADGNVATSSKGHKAVAMSETEVKAGTKDNPGQFAVTGEAKKTYTATGKDGSAKLDYSDRTEGQVYKPVVSSNGDGVNTKLEQVNGNWQGDAQEQQSGSKHYFLLSGGDKPVNAKVFSKGSQVADVSNLQDKENIVVERLVSGAGPSKGVASTKDLGNDVIANQFSAGALNQQSATLKKDASHVEIRKDLTKTSAYIPKGQKKAILSGSFITSGTATVEYSEATEKDCPYDAYGDRRAPNRQNQPWKYKDPEFKVHYKELKVSGGYDESTDTIKVEWPQCINVTVPISFPQGTQLDKLALGMAVYFPGCPRFVCAGRVCGLEFAAQAGTKVGEACFTDTLCKLEPVPDNKLKDDIIGYVVENAETSLCDKPYTGGKLEAKATVCQHQDDRDDSFKACPLLNFSPDETAVDKKVDVLLRLYEKKRCEGFGCLTNGLGLCNIRQYNLEGCRELGMNYEITAFDLNGDDVKFTGLERKGKGTSGSTSAGGWGNFGFGQNRPQPAATTQVPAAEKPWWQRANWWNSGGK